MSFSRLKGRMKEYGQTQQSLSNHLCLTVTTLNRKLNGKYDFTWGEIVKICKFLNISESEVGKYFFVETLRKTS